MQIKTIKRPSQKLAVFNKREWPIANEEHGFGFDFEWKTENFTLVAYEGKDIVGTLTLKVEVGVALVETLIVGKNDQGKGIGKALLEKAEQLVKEHNAHKIFLVTGKSWNALKFYKSNGYTVTAELPNHYKHLDFVELTKFLT